MIEIPDLTDDLARLIGLDVATMAELQRIVAQTFKSRTTRQKKTRAACGAVARLLNVDEDRAQSVVFTVQNVLAQADELKPVEAHHIFAYMGPVDALMRPFCREHVGKVYTLDQIQALTNDQLDDVLFTGGGWECRHRWTVLSRFSELALLLGTGKRIPEIEAEIAYLDQNPPTADRTGDRPPWCRRHNCPGPLRG